MLTYTHQFVFSILEVVQNWGGNLDQLQLQYVLDQGCLDLYHVHPAKNSILLQNLLKQPLKSW